MQSPSSDLKQVLAAAAADARSHGQLIGTEHLLAALVAQPDCGVAPALARAGVTAESVASTRTRLFGSSPTPPASGGTPAPQVTVFAPAAQQLVDATLSAQHPTAAELAFLLVSSRTTLAAGLLRAVLDGGRVSGMTTQQRIDRILHDLEALR